MSRKIKEKIVVNKIPRESPPPDLPAKFPPQPELHLEMLEIKEKLKKNLPPLKRKVVPKRNITSETSSAPPTSADSISASATAAAASTAAASVAATSSAPALTKSLNEGFKKTPKKKPVKSYEEFMRERGEKEEEEKEFVPEEEETRENSTKSSTPDLVQDNQFEKKAQEETKTPPSTETPQSQPSPAQPTPAQESPSFDATPEEEELSPEEKERQEVEEYVWRFRLLKKKYPGEEIPEFTSLSDLSMMKSTYERTIKELTLNSSVNSYRYYIGFLFKAMEFGCKWMGLDMDGFADNEIASMAEYERFLVELGEKSYNSWGQNIPVEIRLLGFVLFKALFFFCLKNAIGSFISTPAAKSGERKSRMKGPSVKMSDIGGGRNNG
jgi:hypothetical protein